MKLSVLGRLLAENRSFWQFRAFAERDYPWRENTPELVSLLEKGEHDDDDLIQSIPGIRDLRELADLDSLPEVRGREWSAAQVSGVRGRKLAQVRAFCRCIPELGLPYLDWCAGKGHLSQTLLAVGGEGRSSTCLEMDPGLCADGRAWRGGGAVEFQQVDVMADDLGRYLIRDSHALALHACGDLHRRLLEEVVEREVQALSFSPCCYHRSAAENYLPLSMEGRAGDLGLGRDDLRMVGQETVVAGARVKRRGEIEVAYRLGFDSLQRELRGEDRYQSVPNFPKAGLRDGFEAFCRWAAERIELTIPRAVDFSAWEEEGQQRVALVKRLERVQGWFKRPLEVWVISDLARALEEAGYEVEFGEFCPREVTPRNILIRAQHAGG